MIISSFLIIDTNAIAVLASLLREHIIIIIIIRVGLLLEVKPSTLGSFLNVKVEMRRLLGT